MTTDGSARTSRFGLPTDLGTLRTVMAADRTLMAWVRTALSMISFGFTIYKFLEAAAKDPAIASHPESPQRVGLALCALGVASMVLGIFSYWATLKDLQQTEQFRLGRPTLVISLIMALGGIAMFIGIARRLI